jgi:hypothetical protein
MSEQQYGEAERSLCRKTRVAIEALAEETDEPARTAANNFVSILSELEGVLGTRHALEVRNLLAMVRTNPQMTWSLKPRVQAPDPEEDR